MPLHANTGVFRFRFVRLPVGAVAIAQSLAGFAFATLVTCICHSFCWQIYVVFFICAGVFVRVHMHVFA